MSQWRNWSTKHLSVLILLAVCLMLATFLSLRTGSFLSYRNAVNILEASSYRLILAVGMTFIIASGAIDLSVGSIVSLSAIIMASVLRAGWPVPAGLLLGLAMGALMGAANGTLIHFTRINALIITLATSFLYRGLSLMVTLGTPITKLPQSFRSFGYGDFLGMESGVSMAILLVTSMFPILYRMKWGHYLCSLGSNPEALQRSGVSVGKYRISSFALMGVLAALVGVIITARLNSAEPNAGLYMEMDAITAVIMGGTPLRGGRANLVGTVVAVILLGMVRNGLTLLSISSYYQQFITGVVLLLSVLLAEIRERKQRVA